MIFSSIYLHDELLDLLKEALEQLMEIWKVVDNSISDYTIMIETAVKFVDHALKSVINGEVNMKRENVKNLVAETVLEFLNEGVAAEKIRIDSELNESQKTEIREIVEKTLKRPGFMSFTYGGDRDNDYSYLGARIDPQNTKNWARTKEEVLFRAPYRLSEAIQSFTKNLLKSHE